MLHAIGVLQLISDTKADLSIQTCVPIAAPTSFFVQIHTMQAIYSAAKSDNAEEAWVKLTAEPGFDINAKNTNGNTALITAAYKGHHQAVDFLLKHGADFSIRNNGGYTAMMYACYRGDKTSIRHLLAKGADPYLRENTGRSAIDLCNNAVTREFLQKEIKTRASVVSAEMHEETLGTQAIPAEPEVVLRSDEDIECKTSQLVNEKDVCAEVGAAGDKVGSAEFIDKLNIEFLAQKNQLLLISRDRDDLKAQLDALQSELLQVGSEKKELTDSLNRLQAAVEAERIFSTEKLVTEKIEYGKIIDELNLRIVALEQLTASISSENQTLLDRLCGRQDEISKLTTALAASTCELQSFKDLSHQLEQENLNLAEKNKYFSEEIENNAKEKIKNSNPERSEEYEHRILELERVIDEQLARTKELESCNEGLLAALENERNEMSQRLQEIALMSMEEILSLKAQLVISESALSWTNTERQELVLKLDELEEKVYGHGAGIQSYLNLVASLQEENELLLSGNNSLQQRLASFIAKEKVGELEENVQFGSGSSFMESPLNDCYITALSLISASYKSVMENNFSSGVHRLSWDQIESTMMECSPANHLSMQQIVLVITAVLNVFHSGGPCAGYIDENDDIMCARLSQSIINLLGADMGAQHDRESPSIPIGFILSVLHDTGVAFPLFSSCGADMQMSVFPAALPSSARSVIFSEENPSHCIASIQCSLPFSNVFYRKLVLRLSPFFCVGRAYKNSLSLVMKCFDGKLTSTAQLELDDNRTVIKLTTAGTSCVLLSLVLYSIVYLCEEECPRDVEIAVSFQRSFSNEAATQEVSSISHLDAYQHLSECFISLGCFFSDQIGTDTITIRPDKTLKYAFSDYNNLSEVLELVNRSREIAHLSFDEKYIHLMDDALLITYLAIQTRTSDFLEWCGYMNHKALDLASYDIKSIQTLWLLCEREALDGPTADEISPEEIWAIPVSPGARLGDAWRLVYDAGFVIGDFCGKNGCPNFGPICEKERLILQALKVLGVGLIPGLKILRILNPFELVDSTRLQALIDCILEHQSLKFEPFLFFDGREYLISQSLLTAYRAMQSDTPSAIEKKSGASASYFNEIDDVYLAALGEDLSQDDQIAVKKAAVVGELNRRLTVRLSPLDVIDPDENGVVASMLLPDHSSSRPHLSPANYFSTDYADLLKAAVIGVPSSFALQLFRTNVLPAPRTSDGSTSVEDFFVSLLSRPDPSEESSLYFFESMTKKLPLVYLAVLCGSCGTSCDFFEGSRVCDRKLLFGLLALVRCSADRGENASDNLEHYSAKTPSSLLLHACSFGLKNIVSSKNIHMIKYLRDVAALLDEDLNFGSPKNDLETILWYKKLLLHAVWPKSRESGDRYFLIPVSQDGSSVELDTFKYVCLPCLRGGSSFVHVHDNPNSLLEPPQNQQIGAAVDKRNIDGCTHDSEPQEIIANDTILPVDPATLSGPSNLLPSSALVVSVSKTKNNKTYDELKENPMPAPNDFDATPAPPPHGCCTIS